MQYDSHPLQYLLDKDSRNELVLPNFQRAFVWPKAKQKSLIASFISDIPIGSILLLDGEADDFAARNLAYDKPAAPSTSCHYLLDGQQRISCLKMVFSDPFANQHDWETICNDLYRVVNNRWFIRFDGHPASDRDLFGWKDLQFNGFPQYVRPDDIIALIEYKTINIGEPDAWHHPAYLRSGTTLNQRNLDVGEKAAGMGLIPLWQIYNNFDPEIQPIHYYALDVAADERRRRLKAETRGDDKARTELLKQVDPQIERKLGDPQALDSAWNKLGSRWVERVTNAMQELLNNQIPYTELPTDELDRAISIFQHINEGGTQLEVFDLVVARAAIDQRRERSLRARIVEQFKKPLKVSRSVKTGSAKTPPDQWSASWIKAHDSQAPTATSKNQYLNLLAIFAETDHGKPQQLSVETIREATQKDLSSQKINLFTEDAVRSYKRALSFLQYRCGIRTMGDIGYKLMVLPIAYLFKDDNAWESEDVANKVEYWYWSSLFGGSYEARQRPQVITDIASLWKWASEDGSNPFEERSERVLDRGDYSDEDTLLLKNPLMFPPPTAVGDGILQFILSRAPQDPLPKGKFSVVELTAWGASAKAETFQDSEGHEYEMSLNKHHVIPLAQASTFGESSELIRDDDAHILNSPLNLTFTSSTANQALGAKPIQDYVKFLDNRTSSDHFIPPGVRNKYSAIRKGNLTEEDAYLEILKERYDLIKGGLDSHLRNLLR